MYATFNARALGLSLSPDETVRLAAAHGFAGVDILVRDALDRGADFAELRRRMDDLGLRGGAFPFPFDWRGDETRFRDDLARLPACAEAAAALGITRTGTWVLPETSFATAEEADAFHLARLAPVAAILGGFGIRLGLEVIGVAASRTGRGRPYLTRHDALGRLRAQIEAGAGTPVGIIADAWHLYAADEPVAHALAYGVEAVVAVHVADLPAGATPDRAAMVDSVRGLPGAHGAVDSAGLLAALDAAGYAGPVMAEPLAGCRALAGMPTDAVAARAAASVRSIWPA